MGRKHYQTVDLPRRKPHVGRRLFGINLQIIHFKFQFFKQKISLSQNSQKFTQNRQTVGSISADPSFPEQRLVIEPSQTVVNEKSRGIWHYLKRDRDTEVRGEGWG